MKTHDEILKGLEQCRYIDVPCDSCPYDKEEVDNCQEFLLKDAAAFIRQLLDVNRALRTELATNHIGDGNKKAETKPWGQYWQNICDMNERQEAKGKKKYGEPLEENTTLTTTQRIEHAQEEAIDLLKYLEHLKQVAEDGITANDYQRAALRTDNKNQTEEERMLDALFGLCGEAGEVMDAYKKYRFQGHESYRDEMIIEASDCLWYLAKLADVLGVTLGEVMERNIEKLKKRFPEGFSKERSVNREQ